MNLSFETKVQCGLVLAAAAMTGIIVYQNHQLKAEMAKLLASNGAFVDTAAKILDAVELGNEKIEDGNRMLADSSQRIDDAIKRFTGGVQ